MKTKSFLFVEHYIKDWKKKYGGEYRSDKVETNNAAFINAFLDILKESKIEQWEFLGNPGYSGFVANFWLTPTRSEDYFEIAYFGSNKNKISIFRSDLKGSFIPEYISLNGNACSSFLTVIKEKLLKWGGF